MLARPIAIMVVVLVAVLVALAVRLLVIVLLLLFFPDCCLVRPSTLHVTLALGSIIPCFDPMSLATSYQTICH